MHFEILDKNLKIAACSVQELPADVAMALLKQWEPETPLKSLTIFTCTSQKKRFGEWYDWAILNKDYSDFGRILNIARVILSGATFKNPVPGYQESIEVLESLYDFREKEKLFFKADNTVLTNDEMKLLFTVAGAKPAFEYSDVRRAFAIGIMKGKQEERAKKQR